jgi:glycosyltransferase involved in cell wall biosynthesis
MEKIGKDPKVSVCVVTYNQVKYIGQCLQSILDQKTDFEFEIIVGDDASTDGTTDVVREFAERYPENIIAVLHKENVGPAKNYFSVHNIAKGQYIAHLDGDDYCLPNKLQVQSNLLDSDPKCNMVFHRMLVQKPNGEISNARQSDIKANDINQVYFDRKSIIQFIAIASHSSKMYRKVVRDFDMADFDMLDYYVNVEQVGMGTACLISDGYYGVYRAGIGISATGIKTRMMLKDCFIHFFRKYPEHRLQVNTAALMYFIMDLKNWRKTWPMFLWVWVKTFHIGSIFNLLSSLSFMRQLRLNW